MQGGGPVGRRVVDVPLFLPVVPAYSPMGVWLGADRCGGRSGGRCGWAAVLRGVSSEGIQFLGGFNTACDSWQAIRGRVDDGSWLMHLWDVELPTRHRSRHRLARAFYVSAVGTEPGTLLLRLAGSQGEEERPLVRLCIWAGRMPDMLMEDHDLPVDELHVVMVQDLFSLSSVGLWHSSVLQRLVMRVVENYSHGRSGGLSGALEECSTVALPLASSRIPAFNTRWPTWARSAPELGPLGELGGHALATLPDSILRRILRATGAQVSLRMACTCRGWCRWVGLLVEGQRWEGRWLRLSRQGGRPQECEELFEGQGHDDFCVANTDVAGWLRLWAGQGDEGWFLAELLRQARTDGSSCIALRSI